MRLYESVRGAISDGRPYRDSYPNRRSGKMMLEWQAQSLPGNPRFGRIDVGNRDYHHLSHIEMLFIDI
jgi:hypothetical protein